MIHSVFIINNTGKPRLSAFYQPVPPTTSSSPANAVEQSDGTSPAARTAFIQHLFGLIGQRSDSLCNFVDVPSQTNKLRVVYRHYATLFFIFVVDEAESELGILDLIQVFVESLDRCFENVCELDLVFHFDEVHLLLSCIVVGGMVVDTSIESITNNFRASLSARKSSQNENLVLSAPSAFDFKSIADRFSSGLSRR